jgi:E3 ubiquitin-protein ligase RNF38/44
VTFFVLSLQELLALEEQIGDVNTGLTKSHIVDKLRTSLYVPGISSMSDQPSKSSLENDACIICQVLLLHCILCLLTIKSQLSQV